MDLYTSVAYQNSRVLTLRYSSSFGLSSRLLARSIRPHIYAIYGLVRIADEIVDTYKGDHSLRYLNDLEAEVYDALKTGYGSNPIVHAFAQTGRKYKLAGILSSRSLPACALTSCRIPTRNPNTKRTFTVLLK